MCRAFLGDPNHQFRKLWSPTGWIARNRGDEACWGRQNWEIDNYFRSVIQGHKCSMNWYTGNSGELGKPDGGPTKQKTDPHFTQSAPAVLGFDEAIDYYCNQHDQINHAVACVKSNVNILSLYGKLVPYNSCRNFEWQVCAALGQLPGQGGNTIRFARPPKTLHPNTGDRPIGSCTGYHPEGCDTGFASSDIFYMETCLYAQICANGDELFTLGVGQDFHCTVDQHRFMELQKWLTSW